MTMSPHQKVIKVSLKRREEKKKKQKELYKKG
jgi:hypothetical protein